MKVLVVTNPFGGHAIGHEINDPQQIEQILASDHAHHVVRSDRPEPARAISDIYHPDELAKHAASTSQPDETKGS